MHLRRLASNLLTVALTVTLTNPAHTAPTDDSYNHPLQPKAVGAGTAVPVPGQKDAPNGDRYVVTDMRSENGVRLSGVMTIPHWPLGAEEKQILWDQKLENGAAFYQQSVGPDSVLGDSLVAVLSDYGNLGVLQVELRLSANIPDLHNELESWIALGWIKTYTDVHEARQQLVLERQAMVAAHMSGLVDLVDSVGGQITRSGVNGLSATAILTPPQIAELAAAPEISRIELSTWLKLEGVRGGDVLDGSQITQFVDDGFDGENSGNPWDVTFAAVDLGRPHDDHVGYRETSGSSSNRIRGRYICDGDGDCSSVSNFLPQSDPDGEHATAVAGIVFGDLRDGQDSTVTSTQARIERSGYAGESRGWLYDCTLSTASLRGMLDHVVGVSPAPSVVNASLSVDTAGDADCDGDTGMAADANDLYESGILLIKSAGNDPGSSLDCTIGAPGAAIGVFTVGGHGDGFSGGESDVRDDPIFYESATNIGSSYGGTHPATTEGGGRSIVDLTAFAYREVLFDTDGNYGNRMRGTSFATPTVAAAAIDFIDFYRHEWSNLIDNPGVLFVNLLQMGDREQENPALGPLLRRFDHLWGAGRMKMRKYDAAGMDTPWGFGTGFVCIDHDETYVFTLNDGNALSSDVDYLKVSIWWYDRRHEVNGTVDDIDLYVREIGSQPGFDLGRSNDLYDNKERVFTYDVGGKAVQIDVIGSDVTTDAEGCGTNSMKVFYSYFYEDGDRDDANGPGAEIEAE